MRIRTRIAAATVFTMITAGPAMAIQHVVTLTGVVSGEAADQRYEFAGDFLQTHYDLTKAGASGSFGPSYLPPLERAVAQVRTQQGSYTRGLHAPSASTGLPVSDGGTGVFQAPTNFGSLAPSSVSTAWVSNQAVAFTLARNDKTVTYTMGSNVWTHTAASVAEINAFQFRLRSATSTNANTNITTNNGVTLSNVTFTQGSNVTALGCSAIGVCGVGLAGAFTANAGDVHISLFDRVSGDFTIAGNWAFDLTGGRLNGNNAQIKLLSVPAVPEPSSWAMLIAGFGLVGATLRRRRTLLA